MSTYRKLPLKPGPVLICLFRLFPGAPVHRIARRTIVIDDPYDEDDIFKVTEVDNCYKDMNVGNNQSDTDLLDYLGKKSLKFTFLFLEQ